MLGKIYNCPRCGRELVFVYDGRYHVAHAPVNLHDRDYYNAGARIQEPSPSHARRLVRQMLDWQKANGEDCGEHNSKLTKE